MTQTTRGRADAARQYDVDMEWTEADLAILAELKRAEESLPPDAPRALLSVRLSVFNEETTSPVRQELDLRLLAREKGYRVVGVASDLNVSATKVPPWKRKELGKWLSDRTPEFDVLLFWKLDRFIRNLNDLNVMIQWGQRYGKNLVSKHDPIDLSTTMGRIMVTVIGGVAEIEAANTKTRVESMWEYTKTQSEWNVGKPPYGYNVQRGEDGKNYLAINDHECMVLHEARRLLLAGRSMTAIVEFLKEKDWVTPGLTVATLTRRLRNPGTLGYRVEENMNGGYRRSKLLYGRDGKPIRVGDPIFTQDEWDTLQTAIDRRSKNQPTRNPDGATKFLGVLKCADCGTNMTVHQSRNKHGEYAYLRCRNCKSGGLGAPHPMAVYERLVADVLTAIGNFPVETREYAQGEEARKEMKRLQETISHYMQGLEPGGRYAKTRFTREQAESTLDKLIAELEAIDPETTQDRWVYVAGGKTYREHWEEGGMEAMAEDLLRAGITCVVTRTKVPRQRAPEVHLKLRIPRDVRERLVRRRDDFAEEF